MYKSRVSPFYNNVKIPRKLKKKVKKYVGVHWSGQTNEQRLWHYLECCNPKLKELLILKICENEHETTI